MRIHLVCSAGMSTSLLVNNMKKSAPADYVIDAGPFAADGKAAVELAEKAE